MAGSKVRLAIVRRLCAPFKCTYPGHVGKSDFFKQTVNLTLCVHLGNFLLF